ncbi:hypothetical protein EDC96DRAFT_548432 [Choanephora cucurbitarum]|nr:hypothetical protein EDC96DRAFT_548432 [Choanephora cucurbitarum]
MNERDVRKEDQLLNGLVARIRRSHRRGRGSIPRWGIFIGPFFRSLKLSYFNMLLSVRPAFFFFVKILMNFNHKLEDIATRSAGFESSKTILSQAIYTDLVLGKKWKEVDYKPVQSLDTCVFLAKDPDRYQEQLFILPIFQESTKLSIERIKDIFDSLSKDLAIEEEIE